MTKLDRVLQRKMLDAMREEYPQLVSPHAFDTMSPDAKANAYYLWEHDLVDATWTRTLDGNVHCGGFRITAKGMDFLADDGGLSAIFGVVTVRLHEDTIKALLIEEVEKATAAPDVKSKLREQIKSLPAEAMKSVVLEAVKAGLARTPDLVQWLQTVLAP